MIAARQGELAVVAVEAARIGARSQEDKRTPSHQKGAAT